MNDNLQLLVGAQVTIIKFSTQWVNFVFERPTDSGPNKYAELSIEADFEITDNSGIRILVTDSVTSQQPVLPILKSATTAIDLSKNYVLNITFDNGYRLKASPIEQYEAWSLSGEDLGHYIATGI